MKVSASFSGKEIENTSLDFSKLREEGLEYIQELSGDIWTDYNSHDPGVTILEQLVYALTDVAYRTSLPIEDLLTTEENILFARKNGFFAPPQILSTHPVTIQDTRKMIIDRFFDEIQNVWMIPTENFGFEEKLNGINQIEILPKIKLLKSLEEPKKDFLKEVNLFLKGNRNIGEWYEEAILLKPQKISINFQIFINDRVSFHATIANLFLNLFEFIYSPIQFSSLYEMKDSGSSMQEIFSGPKLKNGFIKIFSDKQRRKVIYTDQIQKLLSKMEGIVKCVVNPFSVNNGKEKDYIETNPCEFFHLLNDDNSNNLTDNRFDRIYENMTVFVNNKEFKDFDKQKINNLAIELWSKKYRRYPIGNSQNKLFLSDFKGNWHELKKYCSVQRHFPIIYGIGEEGLSKHEPEERKAQVYQLKAFLMLFEQHLANHLAQLSNLNEFFNISFNSELKKTYFTQWMDSIPKIDELATKDIKAIESYLESDDIFFDRKNRIYDHLLARFGEEFNEIPWKISKHVHLLRNNMEYYRTVLRQKSQFIKRLYKLTYYRTRGEYLIPSKTNNNLKCKRIPSGLEEIIIGKTGIKRELKNSFIHNLKISYKGFDNMDEKTLFRETLKIKNYKIQKSDSKSDELQVEFLKEKDNWIKITDNEDQPVQDISKLTDFFIKLNLESECIYIVDHILLKDFLKGSKCGFSYLDEKCNPLFHTNEQESWFEKKEERDEIFRPIELKKENFSVEKGKWIIRYEKWEPIEFTIENNEFYKIKSDIENDTYIYSDGKLKKKSDDTTNKKSEKELDIEKLTIEKLTKIFDDVYSKTKNLNCPIKMALFPNFYCFEKEYWTIKYRKHNLASFKIIDEDLVKIKNILELQAFSFKDGKWRIQNNEKMSDRYKIKNEDLQTIITVLDERNYFFEDEKWKLKEKDTITDYHQWEEEQRKKYFDNQNNRCTLFNDQNVQKFISDYDMNLKILTRIFETGYQKNKSIIQLLNNPEDSGRLRFNEMEEIRFRGTKDAKTKNYGQRRLVFQRKLSDDFEIKDNVKIVNEDFFNLKVSIIMPDWPARFQEEQFRDYVKELVHERIPSHISNEIYWVDIHQMKSFELKYNIWKNLKAESIDSENPSKDLMQAAFDVYTEIQKLKKIKK